MEKKCDNPISCGRLELENKTDEARRLLEYLIKKSAPNCTESGRWYQQYGVDLAAVKVYAPWFINECCVKIPTSEEFQSVFNEFKRFIGVNKEFKQMLSLNEKTTLPTGESVEFLELYASNEKDPLDILIEREEYERTGFESAEFEEAQLRLDNWNRLKPLLKERVLKAIKKHGKGWRACACFNRFETDKMHPCRRWELEEVVEELVAEGRVEVIESKVRTFKAC